MWASGDLFKYYIEITRKISWYNKVALNSYNVLDIVLRGEAFNPEYDTVHTLNPLQRVAKEQTVEK